MPAESARAEQKHQELERRLDHLTREPIEFADEFAAYSVTEQEIWLRALAEHARSEARGAEALDALRLAGDPGALEVATAFAAELRRVGAEARAAVAFASPTR